MNLHSLRTLHAAVLMTLTIAVAPPLPAQTPAKTYRGCAVVDMAKVLRQSKASKAAQARLVDEFAQQEARLKLLRSARVDAEVAWRNAASSGPEAHAAAARHALDAATAELRDEQNDFDRRLKKRKQDELDSLIDRLNALYRQIGEREGYAKLYQTDEPDPVFEPEPEARSFQCTTKTDVTDALIRDLDASL